MVITEESRLSVVGKVLADIILQIHEHLAEKVYPQSQSGYRSGRSAGDGIFTLRQLMEKSGEQLKNLYIAFVDFTKAFNMVNREIFFEILGRFGCPVKFIRILKKLYTNVHVRLIVKTHNLQDLLSCKLAPSLYDIYAAVLLWLVYKKIKHMCSMKARFRYDGDLFDLRRLKSKSKVLTKFLHYGPFIIYGTGWGDG